VYASKYVYTYLLKKTIIFLDISNVYTHIYFGMCTHPNMCHIFQKKREYFSISQICTHTYIFVCVHIQICVCTSKYVCTHPNMCHVFQKKTMSPLDMCTRINTYVCVCIWDERRGAGVETQKNVRGEIGGWGRVPFNETYAPSLSTIYDGA